MKTINKIIVPVISVLITILIVVVSSMLPKIYTAYSDDRRIEDTQKHEFELYNPYDQYLNELSDNNASIIYNPNIVISYINSMNSLSLGPDEVETNHTANEINEFSMLFFDNAMELFNANDYFNESDIEMVSNLMMYYEETDTIYNPIYAWNCYYYDLDGNWTFFMVIDDLTGAILYLSFTSSESSRFNLNDIEEISEAMYTEFMIASNIHVEDNIILSESSEYNTLYSVPFVNNGSTFYMTFRKSIYHNNYSVGFVLEYI